MEDSLVLLAKASAIVSAVGQRSTVVLLSCAAMLLAQPRVNAGERVEPSASAAGCSTAPAIPDIPSNAKLAPSPSGADDTAVLQGVISRLRSGDTLVFPAGNFSISKHLTIAVDGVSLFSKGATITSMNPADGGLMVSAKNVSIYNFNLKQNSTSRQNVPWASGIAVMQTDKTGEPRIRGTVLQGNHIETPAGVGIFIFRADAFSVVGNTVSRSWADGIHITAGSSNGRVIHNSVSQTGDDMIAVVSYTGNRSSQPAAVRYKDWSNVLSLLDNNIYISNNTVSDNYWGRGISVVGGTNVTIENNTISRVPAAAGIYLERETAFMTLGDHDILVRGNVLSEIETSAPTYKPPGVTLTPTHHGAFEIGSSETDDEVQNPIFHEEFAIADVSISDNLLQTWGYAPIRIGQGSGPVHSVLIKANDLRNAKASDVVETHGGLDTTQLVCGDNLINGSNQNSNCSKGLVSSKATVSVNGASLKCSSDGKLIISAVPKAPVNLRMH